MARRDKENRTLRRNLRQGKPNTGMARPSPEPNLVTGAAPRRLSQPSPEPNLVTGAGERRTPAGIRQSTLRSVVSSSIEGQRDAKLEGQLDQVTEQASSQLTQQRTADRFNDVMESSQQINDEPREPQGLRRFDREELRRGLADGSLGTFSVEGRDPSSLRSVRDAAGVTEDGALVFDQRGLRRLSNRLSVVSPQQDDLTDPNVLARNLQGGLITEDEATQVTTAQANRVNQEKNRLEALSKSGQNAPTIEDRITATMQTANSVTGAQEGSEAFVDEGMARIFMNAADRFYQQLPEGTTDIDIGVVAGLARLIPQIKQGITLPFIGDDPSAPLSPEPVFDLIRRAALSPPTKRKFEFGGQTLDIGELPPTAQTAFNTMASSIRQGFVGSAARTFVEERSQGKDADEAIKSLNSNERKAVETQFEQDKERRIAQARESFMQQNKNRTLRPGTDDGRFSPFSPEQEKQLSALKNMTLEEYLLDQMTGSSNGR